jgi:DNA-binding beta-propeller fold protein YncE
MNMLKKLLPLCLLVALTACDKDDQPFFVNEDPAGFAEISSLDIGGTGAAEITAYDPITQRLFVVNNDASGNKIDVIDFKNPAALSAPIAAISITAFGAANSVAVSNGKLAVAIESSDKQAPGKVVVYNTNDYKEVKVITVGSLPDMVTYSPDGNFILTANEGEPNDAYANDPEGSISIINVRDNYAVTTLNLAGFASQEASLRAKGLRKFGLNASFAKDMEPEYIAISDDSRTAWVTLQENNAIAKVDINSKTITDIFPLGFKDYNLAANAVDLSDRDGGITLKNSPVFGMYQPDAIAFYQVNGIPYLFTANEGDAREYAGFNEMKRAKDWNFDATVFPNAAALKADAVLGRLNVSGFPSDTDGDGDIDGIFSLGARSFSVWNGNTGALVFDSKNDLEQKAIAAAVYDDGRSDDKGVEPEGIALGMVGNKKVAFVGLERADAVALYDVTNPANPIFLQLLKCGDAPEGVLFIPAKDAPGQQSLLIVSSENDGVIKVYRTKTL